MAADGVLSLRKPVTSERERAIAKELNSDGVPPPRGTKKKTQPTWVYTAIREMLRRELYVGRQVWNKRKYKKRPGTNKRISVPSPESEWVINDEPHLRIVPQELWNKVQFQLKRKAELFPGSAPGMTKRSASVKYLFSGLLKCGMCEANLTIVTGRGKDHKSSAYGCPHHLNRGTCSNDLRIRRNLVENQLLAGLSDLLLADNAVDYCVSQLASALSEKINHEPEEFSNRSQ
jgi:site-specific DNA recombinase